MRRVRAFFPHKNISAFENILTMSCAILSQNIALFFIKKIKFAKSQKKCLLLINNYLKFRKKAFDFSEGEESL